MPNEPWRSALDKHEADPFAHNAMTARLLAANTHPLTKRVEALEQFKAQVIVLGGIGFILLGAVASAVAIKLLGAH